MNKNIEKNQNISLLNKFAWLPIFFLFIIILTLKFTDNRSVFVLPVLQVSLNLLTRTLPYLLIIFFIGKSYLNNGMTGYLFLGYGVFILGISGYIPTLVTVKEANLSITINNIGIWLSSVCQLTGTILLIFSMRNFRFKIFWLISGYMISLSIMGLLILAASNKWLPLFFIQGYGGTIARHSTLVSTIALYVLAVILLLESNRKQKNPFIYWYALSMILIAVGMFGLLIELSANSLLDWTSRAAQYLNGIYMLVAAIISGNNQDLFNIKQKNMLKTLKRFRYSMAVTVVLAAIALRFIFLNGLGTNNIFLTFYPAVITAALYGGLRSGLAAAILSAVAVDYFWTFPFGSFSIGKPSDWLSIAFFFISCIMISIIANLMHLAQAKSAEADADAKFTMERQQAAEKLIASEERFRTLANAIPQLAWIAHGDGYIFWYNKRWYDYTGTTPAQMEGWGWQGVHDPEVLPSVMERWKTSIATGEPFDMEFPLRCKDGTLHPFLTRIMPLKDSSGRVIQWFGTNTDVTELKKSELELHIAKEAAENANQTKSLFIAGMSHELRTPLNAIMGYAQLFKKSGDLSEKQTDSIAIIYNSSLHLLNMINDLLDISKIEAGKMNLENKTFHLPDLLKKVTDIIHLQAEEKNLDFIFNPKSEIPLNVLGDEKRVSQILLNLLSNAVKFTDNGFVSLNVEMDGKNVRFEVKDTGIGISQENMEIIFDSFHQLDSGMSKTKGTGLGLSISRSLVRLMGSELHVKSEIGKGSVFWFEINSNLPNEEYDIVDSMTFNKKASIEDLSYDIQVPDGEELKDLYSMVKIGDIINIRKYIDQIENENQELKQFASILKLLAKKINLTEIEKFIRKYIKK